MTNYGRQPDPEPKGLHDAPSLLAYFGAIAAGVGLCAAALLLTNNRRELWAALFLNVGSGLAGSVIVFVAIERRLRAVELRRLGAVLPRWYSSLFHPHLDARMRYVQLLLVELGRIQPTLTRPPIDLTVLLEKHPQGFCLIGPAGTGKTVAIQQFCISIAKAFVGNPRNAPLPILLPMRLHRKAALEDNLWYEGMLPYGVRQYVANAARRTGDRIVLLDGLDESSKPEFRNEVASLVASPHTIVVATSRHEIAGLSLPVVPVESVTA